MSFCGNIPQIISVCIMIKKERYSICNQLYLRKSPDQSFLPATLGYSQLRNT